MGQILCYHKMNRINTDIVPEVLDLARGILRGESLAGVVKPKSESLGDVFKFLVMGEVNLEIMSNLVIVFIHVLLWLKHVFIVPPWQNKSSENNCLFKVKRFINPVPCWA